MVLVEIFHNVATDETGRPLNFLGYQPGQPIVKVFVYESEGADPTEPIAYEELAEEVYCLGNGIAHSRSGEYYARKLRSPSVGDLIRIGEVWMSVERASFKFLPAHEPNDITDKHEGEHGTQPWKE
ncbi:hypothetical protein [Spirillospora sp. CA-294931]|uniref:hypothetical protein n=1 Tax=Spirillospora sp. CA-294931 TaxID=3240042 RepID=UPI003D9011BA